jgi:glycosyltransferase involved in cell wall biosynthesis
MAPKQRPTCSIIITCYNYAQYLPEAIESALAQTLPADEIIIVNDGSTDDTAQVAADYAAGNRQVQVISQPNQGISIASNNGVRASLGTYFVRLDADDRFDARFLERTVQALEANPRRGYAYTSYQYFGARSEVVGAQRFSLKQLTFRPYIVATSLIRRAAYETACGYSPEMRRAYEDWDFYLAMAEAGWYGMGLSDVLFFYRRHGRSRNALTVREWIPLLHQIYRRHRALYREPFATLLCRAIADRATARLLDRIG